MREKQGVACIVLREHPETQVLLLLRAFGEFRGEWCFVAGHVHPNEQAAARELLQETGLSGSLSPLLVSYPDSHLKLSVYLGRVPDQAISLNPEHSEARWFSFDEARELLPLGDQREALLSAESAANAA